MMIACVRRLLKCLFEFLKNSFFAVFSKISPSSTSTTRADFSSITLPIVVMDSTVELLGSNEDDENLPTNGVTKINGDKNGHDYSADEDDVSSCDSELDDGPPPMIRIERSTDIGTLKSALLSKIQERNAERQTPDVKVGKDVLSSLTNAFEKGTAEHANKQEREKPSTLVDKEQYSCFKTKFENIDKLMAEKEEERKSLRATDIQGVGAESLSKAKDRFEQRRSSETQNNPPNGADRKIEIERSDADKKRVQKTFFEVEN